MVITARKKTTTVSVIVFSSKSNFYITACLSALGIIGTPAWKYIPFSLSSALICSFWLSICAFFFALVRSSYSFCFPLAFLLFVTLPTPNYPKILQINRRYSIIHSDEYYVRLFYPVPSVILSKPLSTKEAGNSPSKVWFPASFTHHRYAYGYKTMITIFVGENNPLTPNFYNNLIAQLQFHRLTCTCGHSGCLSVHGYYIRSLRPEPTVLPPSRLSYRTDFPI